MPDPVAMLQAFLQQHGPTNPHINQLVIALSGGADSYALLRAAATVSSSLGYGVRALHVHHGLHAEADTWAALACEQAAQLGLRCEVLQVSLAEPRNIEAQARRLRYQALTDALSSTEVLLLAHHQRDQAETVWQRLMRRAGHDGLSAMLAISPWQRSDGEQRWRWRPWLNLPFADLRDWLAKQPDCAVVVTDPANHDPRFERTWVRHHVLPLAHTYWPQAEAALASVAEHMAVTSQALDEMAQGILANYPGPGLAISALQARGEAVAQVLLMTWLKQCGAPPLPRAYWSRVQTELLPARVDAQPQLDWGGWRLSRYRDHLYCAPLHERPALLPMQWSDTRQSMVWGGLQLSLSTPQAQMLTLSSRIGGERWRPAGSPYHQTLKKWCQGQAISPAARERMLLLQNEAGCIVALAWPSPRDEWQVAYSEAWLHGRLLITTLP